MSALIFLFQLAILTLPQIYCESYNSGEDDSPSPPPPPPPSRTDFDPASLQLEDWASTHSQRSAGFVRDDAGCPVPSLTATLAIGQHGPAVMEDVFLLNKLAQYNRERIPERVVHAKGHGAFGYFRLTKDLSDLTKADFLNGVGKQTEVLVRFSTTAGEQGSSDVFREERGFAIKFYTIDGIFDLVGNNIGTFAIRDPMLFNDLNRSRKRNPQTHVQDNSMRWDFSAYRPEGISNTLKTFADYPANSRVVNGFGVHAFKLVNREGVPVFVKFTLVTQQPFTWFNSTEIELVSGMDPDYMTRDLFDAIERGDYPKWLVRIQVMTVEDAMNYPVNPFDATKVWRPQEQPFVDIGELVLDRNPENYFDDIEQAAFDPGRMVPGIEASPDRLLIGRLFSYSDAQRYRLGVNYGRLDVNRPKFKVKNYDRDGMMREGSNGGGGPNYYPNTFHGPLVNASGMESVFHVRGVVDRFDTVNDVEHNFLLAWNYLFIDQTEASRKRIAQNLGFSLAKAVKEVRERAVRNLFFRVSEEFGQLVWDEMNLAVAEGVGSSADWG